MIKQRLVSVAILVGVCAVAAGGYHWIHQTPSVTERAEPKPARDNVTLTEGKLAAAAIEVAAVERRTLQPIRTVPGRIEYNGTRHVSVKSPADGLVRKVSVIVGDRVEAGQLLAIVNSPELGERRADVLQQEAELQLAQRERDWWRAIQTNLDDLLSQLKRPQELETLEKDFHDRTLGDYRRDIFSAYSKFRTADAINTNLKAATGGVVTQRMLLEQASLRDSAAATFHSACEQATFDVRQKVGKADAAYDDASRRLAVARQRLTWLTGPPANSREDLSLTDSTKEEHLSTWAVVAPFAASVEEIRVAADERVRQGEDLLLLADTTRLWVHAEIRDKDWSALKLAAKAQLQVQSPALPDQTLTATIAFIGRTVNAETHATPLVADILNDDGLLKPGMFVRVLLPDGPAIQTLAVPESAVVRHEGRIFVFVETAAREFTPRDITLGLAVDPWVEIKSGLKLGDRIVIRGTFLLKSELLLEPEDE